MCQITFVDFRKKRVTGRTESPVERWSAGRKDNDLSAELRALRARQGKANG